MLPLYWRAIVKQIHQAIDKAESAADDRNKRANEAQQEVVGAIKSLTNEFKAYQEKQESAESGKRSRENWTIGSLLATAVVTVALAIIGGLQSCILDKTDATLRETLEANKAIQRAIINVPPPLQISGIAKTDGSTQLVSIIAVRNGGLTGTRDQATIRLGDDIGTLNQTDPKWANDSFKKISRHFIGPKDEGKIQYQTQPVHLDQARIFIFGTVDYRDAFDKPHYTEFCYYVIGSSAANAPSADCDHHNCQDDQCKN